MSQGRESIPEKAPYGGEMDITRPRKRLLPRLSRWRAAVVAGLVAMLTVSSLAACGSTAKAPQASGVKFADAAATASMVYVQTEWSGYVIATNDVENPELNQTLREGEYGPFEPVTSGSGFVASPNGDIITAGHLVDSNAIGYGGKGYILRQMLADFNNPQGEPLTDDEQASWLQVLSGNGSITIEGFETDSPVDRAVTVLVPSVSDSDLYPAQVVDFKSLSDGDVALLHAADAKGAPMLSVAPATPSTGDSVVATGYPGVVWDFLDPTTDPSFMEGTVTGTKTVQGTPFTQISTDVSLGMSGGPILNMKALADQDGQPVAREYRQMAITRYAQDVNPPGGGLQWWAYLAIGLGALVLADGAAGGILMWRRRTRPPGATPAQAGPMPAPPEPTTLAPPTPPPTAPAEPTATGPPPAPAAPAVPAASAAPTVMTAPPVTIPKPATPEPVLQPAQAAQPAPEAQAAQAESQPVPEGTAQDRAAEGEEAHFCSNCGSKHPAEAHFCEHCGQPFAWA